MSSKLSSTKQDEVQRFVRQKERRRLQICFVHTGVLVMRFKNWQAVVKEPKEFARWNVAMFGEMRVTDGTGTNNQQKQQTEPIGV